MGKGSANTARGARRFIEELVAKVRRAGAAGEIVVRVDSRFWSCDTLATLGRLGVRYTMTARTGNKALVMVIAAVDGGPGPISTTPPTARPRWPRRPTRAVA